MTALLGKKIGMTQIFSEGGEMLGVTAIETGPCAVLAVKEKSLQVGFGPVKEKSLKKPQAGFFKKINAEPRKFVREIPRVAGVEYKVGDTLTVDLFKTGDFVDVTSVSKGKGFQGGMKRWHWAGGPATHGHTSHRRVGSIGSTTTPGRVWRGHHMPGHMGDETVTVASLRVVKVDTAHNLLLVNGAVPGCRNSFVLVRIAHKKKQKKSA